MAQMLMREKEWIRISIKDNCILEYSTNQGKNWNNRYKSSIGEFHDLIENGNEIIAQISKGMFTSNTECRNFNK